MDDETKEANENPAEAEAEKPKAKSKPKKIIAIIAATAVLVLAGIGIAVATQPEATTVEAKAPVATEVKKQNSDVYATIKDADGANEIVSAEIKIIVPANIELLDSRNLSVDDGITLFLNEHMKIANLPAGTYELHLENAPITSEGNTFVLPSEPIKFEVSGDGKDVDIDIDLKLLKKEDMSREQLEAVASIIETKAPGHEDLVTELRTKAESAASDPGSASDVSQGSSSEGASDTGSGGSTGGNTDNGSSNTGGNSGSGSSTPTPQPEQPTHTHSYTIPIYGSAPWIVDVPASPGQAEQGYTQNYWLVGSSEYYDSMSALQAARAANTTAAGPFSRWVVTQNAIPATAEQGHWGEAPVIGWRCSGCNAQQ